MDDLKNGQIHQVDYIDDISKDFIDGGGRSFQSLLSHSVTILCSKQTTRLRYLLLSLLDNKWGKIIYRNIFQAKKRETAEYNMINICFYILLNK